MIGLYKAIRDYSPLTKTSFRSYAEVGLHIATAKGKQAR